MNLASFQLKTILRSYETGDHLVYHKQDQIFHSVSSPSRLNKTEYETRSQEVSSLIQNFIQDNQIFLDRSSLLQFDRLLRLRIQQIKGRSGIIGIIERLFSLFYYAFNKQRKARQNQQQLSLEGVKNVVNAVLLEKGEEKNSVERDATESHLYRTPTRPPLPNIASPVVPELPRTLSSTPSKTQTPQPVRAQTPAKVTTSVKIQTPQSTRVQTPNKDQAPQTPLAAVVNLLSSFSFRTPTSAGSIPDAPPLDAPFSASSSVTQPVPSEFIPSFPHEPAPPSFDGIEYKRLSDEQLKQQIADIDAYIEQFENALAPLQEKARSYEALQQQIKENDNQLSKFSIYRERCENIKEYLKDGMKKKFVVLVHQSKVGRRTEIPFYLDQIPKEIVAKHSSAKSSEFPANLTISQYISIYTGLIDHFVQSTRKITTKQTQLQANCGKLREQCQNEHQKDLDTVISLVKNKVQQLEMWKNYRILRQDELNTRDNKRLQAIQRPAFSLLGMRSRIPNSILAREKRSIEDADEFKDEATSSAPIQSEATREELNLIEIIRRLPADILAMIRKVNADGTEPEQIASNFEGTFYGQLVAPVSKKKKPNSQPLEEGKEELRPSESHS